MEYVEIAGGGEVLRVDEILRSLSLQNLIEQEGLKQPNFISNFPLTSLKFTADATLFNSPIYLNVFYPNLST